MKSTSTSRKRVSGTGPLAKRRYERKRNSYRVPGIYRAMVGFPQQGRWKLRYVDRFDILSTAGALNSVSILANSIYAPRISGGHQPLYFDQIMALYNHWVVLGSTCKVSVSFDQNASSSGGVFAVYLNDDSTVVPASITACAEQSSASKAKIASLQNDSVTTLWCNYSAYQVFGPAPIQNVELKGDVSSNCADTTAYSFCYSSSNGTNTVNCMVEIEYDIVFFELKDLASS